MSPDPRLLEWATSVLGPLAKLVPLAAAGSAAVFEATDAQGRGWIVKQHRSMRGFEQEGRALSGWLGGRVELGGARIPRVIAADPGSRALILERLSGSRPDAAAPLTVDERAGRFLAALHGLALDDDDPVPLAEALVRRTHAWTRRAALDPTEARTVAEHGPDPELFAELRRVPCHRDFVPGNWLWDGRRLAILDFEHARMDAWLVDLAKLSVGVWRLQPGRARAFWTGYGRSPTARERRQLRAVVVLHGVASLAWGREHDEPAHVEEGRAALALASEN